jgi:transposase
MTFAGIWYLLDREDFCLLVPRQRPANIDPAEREKFKTDLAALLAKIGPNDLLLFEDESGFCQSGVAKRKWTRRGHRSNFKISGSRKRINVIGAIDPIKDLGFFATYKKALNSHRFIRFIRYLIESNPTATHIYMIADNHPAHASAETYEYLQRKDVSSRLTVLFLPRASPDFNPIELLWHIIKRAVNYNHYYAKYAEFYDTLVRNVRMFKNASGELPTLWKNRPIINLVEAL